MENFNFYNPVKVLFGQGKIKELAKNIPAGAKVLLTYGGGSIKKNGVYEQVVEQLVDFDFVEFGGIEPNPQYSTAMNAVETAKAEQVDYILAVGGGSVVDASKFIAAAVKFEGEAWDILAKGARVTEALPIGVVLTLPATGSEMNANAVISRQETQEKLAFGAPCVMPKFSILDPTYTYSLPARQVGNGIVDAFVHTVEQYLTYPVDSPVQDRMSEGIFVTLIEEGKKAKRSATPDYNNKANIMWAATIALNGILGVGVKSDWATHTIGHELTALHGLDHALTLSIVLPGLMTVMQEKRQEKLVQFAERVWNITAGSAAEKVQEAIGATENFFREMGMLTTLGEHQIGEDTIDAIVERFQSRGMESVGMQADISLDEVREILKERL